MPLLLLSKSNPLRWASIWGQSNPESDHILMQQETSGRSDVSFLPVGGRRLFDRIPAEWTENNKNLVNNARVTQEYWRVKI